MKVRTYQNIDDLYAMLNLLDEGRNVNNGTYYAHRGDLQWWLFYTYTPQEVWQKNIRLWFDNSQLIGWALLTPEEKTFDVFVHSSISHTALEEKILLSAINEMANEDELNVGLVDENDSWRIHWLEKNGFIRSEDYYQLFQRLLSDVSTRLNPSPIPDSTLPTDYSLRHSRGVDDAELRSVASASAFKSKKPFDEYIVRTKNFMQSPVYVPEHEIFVVSPNQEVASFCIVWTDELNKVGHFEPVGTHPDYQGRGLGKNLLHEGLRRLKSEGMREADVFTNHDNQAAIRLYESVGFQKSKKLLTFTKRK
jgi:mycothiol synthase